MPSTGVPGGPGWCDAADAWRPLQRQLTLATCAVAALAWLGLAAGSATLAGSLCSAGTGSPGAFSLREFAGALLGSLLMSSAMMLPAGIGPMLEVARGRHRVARRGRVLGAAVAFTGGYVTCWALIDLLLGRITAIVGAGWGAAADSGSFAAAAPGALLLLVGVHQASPWKARALERCARAPAARHCGGGRPHAAPIVAGLHAAIECVGCCGPIMALVELLGSAQLVWMGAAAAWLLVERQPRFGRGAARLAGAGLITCGGTLALGLLG